MHKVGKDIVSDYFGAPCTCIQEFGHDSFSFSLSLSFSHSYICHHLYNHSLCYIIKYYIYKNILYDYILIK